MIETTNKKEKLKEFQLLLEGPDKEYIDFGKMIAPNSKLVQRENDLGELITQESIAEKNGTTVLTKEELRQELCKYNLAIVGIYNYAGDFDLNYLKNVKEFLDSKKLHVSKDDLTKCLICIYPKRDRILLNTDHTSGSNFVRHNSYMYNGYYEKNPTILYKEEGKDGNNYYHIVHKGKNYKNLFNLRSGVLNSSVGINVLIRLISIILLITLLYFLPQNLLPLWSKFVLAIGYITYNFIYFGITDNNAVKEQFNDNSYPC
jgi:hypothetical protein